MMRSMRVLAAGILLVTVACSGQTADAGRSGSVSPPVLKQKEMPIYPPAERGLKHARPGPIVIQWTVDERGRPTELKVAQSSGMDDFDQAALDAVRQWRYKPAMQDGKPVRATEKMTFQF